MNFLPSLVGLALVYTGNSINILITKIKNIDVLLADKNIALRIQCLSPESDL